MAVDSVSTSDSARALDHWTPSINGGADEDATQRSQELAPEEQQEVRQLQARDREVRAHEMAHAAAGGALAGSPNYTFQTGPDGKRYAVGGDVQIRTGGGRTPEEKLHRAAQVRAAALAPADPSGADRSIAAGAAADAAAARVELARSRYEEAASLRPEGSRALTQPVADGGHDGSVVAG